MKDLNKCVGSVKEQRSVNLLGVSPLEFATKARNAGRYSTYPIGLCRVGPEIPCQNDRTERWSPYRVDRVRIDAMKLRRTGPFCLLRGVFGIAGRNETPVSVMLRQLHDLWGMTGQQLARLEHSTLDLGQLDNFTTLAGRQILPKFSVDRIRDEPDRSVQ